jgi:hypothetical protein
MKDIGGSDIPVIMGELGEYLTSRPNCHYPPVINDSLADICRNNKYFRVASAQGLSDLGDSLHFNSQSLREFGKRYAAEWLKCSEEVGLALE